MDGVSSGRQDDGWAPRPGLTTGWGARPDHTQESPVTRGLMLTRGRHTLHVE